MGQVDYRYLQLRLLNKEKILYAERKHVISLISALLLHPLIMLIIFVLTLFLLRQHLYREIPVISFDLFLCILCVLAVLGTYLFMDWYYDFYVITNQRLIKVHYFHTVGTHYDEVFHHSDAETEVTLVTNNLLYDLLNIEDVQVRFRSLARVEPFVFQTPYDSKKLEEILEQISTEGTFRRGEYI